jgi:hypothetical protein
MMQKGLQAGFGVSLAADIPLLKEIGVQLVRLDCKGLDATETALLALEVSDGGMYPLVIVDNLEQLNGLPRGTNIELLNEPDLNGPEPEEYEKLVPQFAATCEELGLPLWAGSVSNLNERGFEYLRKANVRGWPSYANVSIHRYPNGNSPLTPHGGFDSRYDETATLKILIGQRRWCCTEFGYHTCDRTEWWQKLLGMHRQWTDAQVKEYVEWEWKFWEAEGAASAVLYQINDGPEPDSSERYGIRWVDGAWKPVAATFAG